MIVPTQREAIEKAKSIATNQGGDVVIHGRNGQIRERNSYGNYPNFSKGLKKSAVEIRHYCFYLSTLIRKMPHYKNLDGNSGIRSYEIGLDYIDVQFTDGWKYRYSYSSAGQDNVEEMKLLANAGDGLNSFINRYAKYDYSRKWR